MKRSKPLWLRCLCVVLLTFGLTWQSWLPITERSGQHFTLMLEDSYEYSGHIWLDFGKSRNFRVEDTDMTRQLLSSEAHDKSYQIIAAYKSSKNPRAYYQVYALTSEYGDNYFTLEQSEALRLAMLPGRFIVLAVMDIALFVLIIRKDQKKRSVDSAQHSNKEATP